jgi:predicted phosphodiesterase
MRFESAIPTRSTNIIRSTLKNIWVVIHDLHWGETSMETVAAWLDYIQKNREKIAGFIFAGDIFSNSCISHHNSQKPLYRPKGQYLKDEKTFATQILAPLEKALPKDCKKIYIMGNHDDWEDQIAETQPELAGVISHFDGLKLADKGWVRVPLGHAYKLGHLVVVHGEMLSGINAAKRALLIYGQSVLAGHMHNPQSCSQISPVDAKRKHMAWVAPISGSCNPDYARNKPNAWINGFSIVELHPHSNNFNVYPVITTKGTFSFGGTQYGKKSA